MGRKRKTEDSSTEPTLKLVTKEQVPEKEWINFECPKGHQEAMPAEVNPLCGHKDCNYRRIMKPRRTCPKCEGTGQKFPGPFDPAFVAGAMELWRRNSRQRNPNESHARMVTRRRMEQVYSDERRMSHF